MEKKETVIYLKYNLLNFPLIPSCYNSLTFTYFTFSVYHKPGLFSPAFFLFNNFCLCFLDFFYFLNYPFLPVCLLIRHLPIVPLSLEFIKTLSP